MATIVNTPVFTSTILNDATILTGFDGRLFVPAEVPIESQFVVTTRKIGSRYGFGISSLILRPEYHGTTVSPWYHRSIPVKKSRNCNKIVYSCLLSMVIPRYYGLTVVPGYPVCNYVIKKIYGLSTLDQL